MNDQPFHENANLCRDEQFRQLLTVMPAAAYTCDAQGVITYYNEQAARLWGRSPRLGDTDQRFCGALRLYRLDGTPLAHADTPMSAALRDGTCTREQQVIMERPDGSRVVVCVNIDPLRDAAGGICGAINVFTDVTARNTAEEQLRRHHDTFYHLIQNNPFGVYVVDAEFRLREVSAGAQKIFANVRPLIDRDFAEVLRIIWPEPFAGRVIAIFRHTLETGEPYQSPGTVETREDSGEVEAYDWRIERIMLPDGRFGVVCYFYDLSERQQWEARLRAKRQKLQLALDAAEMGTWTYRFADHAWELDERGREFYGLPSRSATHDQETVSRILHPDDIDRMWRAVRAACDPQGDGRYQVKYRTRRLDGGYRWIRAWGQVEFGDANGQRHPVGMIGTSRDVTAEMEAADELALTSRRYALLSETAGALLSGGDPQDLIEELCRKVMEHLDCDVFFNYLAAPGSGRLQLNAYAGIPDEQASRVRWLEFGEAVCGCVARDGERMVAEDIQNSDDPRTELVRSYGVQAYCCHPLMAGGRPVGTLSFGTRGRKRFNNDELDLMRVVADQVAVAIERLRAERELRAGEERYRTLFECIDEGFCILQVIFDDRDHPVDYRFIELNPAFERHTGMPNAVGRTIRELVPDIEPVWSSTYGQVAMTGEPVRFVEHAKSMGRWFDVYAFRIGPAEDRKVAVLFNDVTAGKQMEQQRAALLEAERAARMEFEHVVRLKDEFLATVSHELRSPLSAIVGWAGLLARGKTEPLKAANIIKRSAASLTQIVEDLLDMSRIMSGKIRLKRESVNPCELIHNAMEAVQLAAEAKDIQFEVLFDPALETLECDPTRIQQIVWNLLTNAIKFTPEGGRVWLEISQSPQHVRLSVRDTGQGIAPEFLPHVFERFRQEDGSIARRHGGLGLGLSIVKHLVELHGGTISAESDGEGLGATFVVNLPRALASFGEEALRPAFTRPLHPGLATLDEDLLKGIRVLCVDDDPLSLELLLRVLSDAGAIVQTTDSTENARGLLEDFRPDVVVSDVGMPGEDGFMFVRKLKTSNDWRARLPAIAVTAFGRPEDREASLAAGFDEHVSKPFDPGLLCSLVRDLGRQNRHAAPSSGGNGHAFHATPRPSRHNPSGMGT